MSNILFTVLIASLSAVNSLEHSKLRGADPCPLCAGELIAHDYDPNQHRGFENHLVWDAVSSHTEGVQIGGRTQTQHHAKGKRVEDTYAPKNHPDAKIAAAMAKYDDIQQMDQEGKGIFDIANYIGVQTKKVDPKDVHPKDLVNPNDLRKRTHERTPTKRTRNPPRSKKTWWDNVQ